MTEQHAGVGVLITYHILSTTSFQHNVVYIWLLIL